MVGRMGSGSTSPGRAALAPPFDGVEEPCVLARREPPMGWRHSRGHGVSCLGSGLCLFLLRRLKPIVFLPSMSTGRDVTETQL